MLFAGVSISKEAAQLAFILDHLHNSGANKSRYYTCFGNSLEEALSGAIKLARHTQRSQHRGDGAVLFVDPDNRLFSYFNPDIKTAGLSVARHHWLVPGLTSVSTVEAALNLLAVQDWAAIVIYSDRWQLPPGLDQLLSIAGKQRVMRIACDDQDLTPAAGPACLRMSAHQFDIFVYGESLAGRQLPFGCFVMSEQAYRIWNHPINALAHSSTFGGNGVTLSLVLDQLRTLGYISTHDDQVVKCIETHKKARNRYFKNHVNPQAAIWLEALNLDLDIQSAYGAKMTLGDGRELLDLAGGTGANLRGHNDPAVATFCDSQFDSSCDYVDALEQRLADLTGYDCLFPGASGATAVECALSIARLARPEKPKIVTFDGNFAGKTLAPLNLSQNGPQKTASISNPFRPYSDAVVYVDPWSSTAETDLERILADNDVGLLWFEIVQGMSCTPIPEALLGVINRERRCRNILVGVDEILTSVWRTNDSFLACHGLLDTVDLVTIAKPLSDMVTPIGLMLTTEDVVAEAARTDSIQVGELRTRYRNQLSAAIAVQALDHVHCQAIHQARGEETSRLRGGLEDLVKSSTVLGSVVGRGLHLRIALNPRLFPSAPRSMLTLMAEGSLQELILKHCGVIVAQQRIFPPIFMPPGTAQDMARRMSAGFKEITVTRVYANAVLGVCRGTLGMLRWGVKRPQLAVVWRRMIRMINDLMKPATVWLAREGYFRQYSGPVVRGDRFLSRISNGRVSAVNAIGLGSLELRIPDFGNSPDICVRLIFAHSDGSIFVAGTNFGKDTDPKWADALRTRKRCNMKVGGRNMDGDAVVLSGPARESAWELLNKEWHGFSSYEESSGRKSPVFELIPDGLGPR
jgi:acetylornithine/succinyldiaminopimelate/putrescine aminotransferase